MADTWDENNPSRPKTMGYMGSEDFIRLQFEEYLLALLSSIKYHIYLTNSSNPLPLATVEGDPVQDFNPEWIHTWCQTSSFALFHSHTDSHLFDIVEPRHPTAGNLSFEDIQRRLTQQIQMMHLDDRFATSKETLNRHLVTGQEKVSETLTHWWAKIEAAREAQQRKRAEAASRPTTPQPSEAGENARPKVGLDTAAAQASVAAAGQKAGAYLSSWGSWAADKRKGWGRMPSMSNMRSSTTSPVKVREKSWDGGSGKSPTKKEEKGGDGIGRIDA